MLLILYLGQYDLYERRINFFVTISIGSGQFKRANQSASRYSLRIIHINGGCHRDVTSGHNINSWTRDRADIQDP